MIWIYLIDVLLLAICVLLWFIYLELKFMEKQIDKTERRNEIGLGIYRKWLSE